MGQEVYTLDMGTQDFLVTTSTVPADKSVTGEQVRGERVFPLPTIQDDMTPAEFGEAIADWLDTLSNFAAGTTVLSIVDEDGDTIWNEVGADTENALAAPFLEKSITFSTVMDMIRRCLMLDHNKDLREYVTEKAGISKEKPKKGRRAVTISRK